MESADCVLNVSFMDEGNQLSDKQIKVGFVTRQVLVRIQDEVQPYRLRKFYSAVRAFFLGAVSYHQEVSM